MSNLIPNPEIGLYGLILLTLIACSGPQIPEGEVSEPTLQTSLADLRSMVKVDREITVQGIPSQGDACINCSPCPISIDPEWNGWEIKTAIFAQFALCVGGGIDGTPDAIVDENESIRKTPLPFSKYMANDVSNYRFVIGVWQRGF